MRSSTDKQKPLRITKTHRKKVHEGSGEAAVRKIEDLTWNSGNQRKRSSEKVTANRVQYQVDKKQMKNC